jgi:hypothetical protein
MSERKVHFGGSAAALAGYAFAPCGARLLDTDTTDEGAVTCTHCLRWLPRIRERRIVGTDREDGSRDAQEG